MEDPDANTTLTSPDRLRKIDQLREKNVGTHMPLPQLVVVGDQSSGKSSLLESLTGIPFPNGQGLCTRYATQISHRRDPQEEVVVGVIPGPDASDEHKRALGMYTRKVKSTGELRGEFGSILREVNALMGIRTQDNPDGSKTFSRDVLKIEKCGPAEDYLTVIDVPGIFRNTEEGVTTESDKIMVLDMVRSYIEQDRTVILAVLPSTVDIMTQEILNLAEQYDKNGERTLGVLTKPDLLAERSTKAVICDLVNGKKRPLNLGYHVVRNRGADEEASDGTVSTTTTRHREKMFEEEPWCHLPRDRVGVVALRERLQDLLGHITDKAFPKLRAEARKMLAECKSSLDDLGLSRDTQQHQQVYLSDIAARFQKIVRGVLDANYSTLQEIDESDNLRLITIIVNITEKFNCDFIRRSNAYSFENEQSPVCHEGSGCPCSGASDDKSWPDGSSVNFPELDSILDTDWLDEGASASGSSQTRDIMAWISHMYSRSRGVEVGTFAPGLLSSAFREQSQNWKPMVKLYLSRVILVIHHFIVAVLGKICTDTKVFDELKSAMDDELLRRYQASMEKAVFLVDIEREAKPYTLNVAFSAALQGARSSRITAPLVLQCGETPQHEKYFNLFDIRKALEEKSNPQEVTESIHDILEAYYKVARERIVDNLFRQVVDHCLLTGPMSPLGLFSEKWVLGLDKQDLASIAGESRLVSHKREQLTKKMEDLESALKILR
ncbi:hypothetical protein E4U21_005128 [Claviceps maximensis]|nr:hypothetical protein E4U21_005128 [Claviceps maximensis]